MAMAIKMDVQLSLPRCPHCRVDLPRLGQLWHAEVQDHRNKDKRHWATYGCGRCGGVVLTTASGPGQNIQELFPDLTQVEDDIPSPARDYLQQALDTIHAPAGSVMLAASAVDAMLKNKGYESGSLYSRIDKAVKDGLLTADMGKWAHQVRLDANDQRHADSAAALPDSDDARRAVEFVKALASLVFVLPKRVTRGLLESSMGPDAPPQP